jgi:hypothetical protein
MHSNLQAFAFLLTKCHGFNSTGFNKYFRLGFDLVVEIEVINIEGFISIVIEGFISIVIEGIIITADITTEDTVVNEILIN